MKHALKSLMLGLFASFISIQSDASENTLRIPTVTILVKQYADLENNLQQAILNNNKKALNEMLANDFEERDGSNPNNPIPKEMWINKMLSQQHSMYRMEQIAVRDFGNIRMISFLLIPKQPNKQIDNKGLFIVDVWQNTDEHNQLLIRYSTEPNMVLKVKMNKKY